MLYLVQGALPTEIHGKRFLLRGGDNHQEITGDLFNTTEILRLS